MGGELILSPTCTGGDIEVSGVGTLYNNAGLAVESTGLNSPSQSATALLAAATATPIHANVKQMNSTAVLGTGIEADKWRGSV